MSIIIDSNKTNRVMIVAGSTDENSARIYETISKLCTPKGYEMVRVFGDDLKEELDSVYQSIKKEPVLEEAIGYDKKSSKPIMASKKSIYVLAYKESCRDVMEAFENKDIVRFYLISPKISGMFDDRTKKWEHQTEILISKDGDKENIKECKRMCRRYGSHMNVVDVSLDDATQESLQAVREWLTGKRNKSYGGNKALPLFLALGFSIGYLADIMLRQNGIVLSDRVPVGSIVGLLVVLLIEEIWRRH